MLRWFEHRQVYQPGRRLLESTGAELGRPFEEAHFRADDGVALHAWFYPASPDSARAGLAVLVCHGNAGNISHRLDICSALLETGVAVFLFDYRGFGRSQGRPSEEGTYRDAQAAHRWLQQKGFAPERILALGVSLGGGIASELARREPLAGLALQNTFCSIPAIGAELYRWLPVRWICRIKYDTCSRLPKLHLPVLVMHSRHDELIGFHHARKNFAAANEPKLFWELAGEHNDPLADRANFIEGIEKFLQLVESTKPAVANGAASPIKAND
jgi:pimeloyl-ACP methyl ester carboxylesterase